MSGKLVAPSARTVDSGNDVSRVFTACLDASYDLFSSPAAVERDICLTRVAGEPDLSNGARAMSSRLGISQPAVRIVMARRTPPARRRPGFRSPSES
jgi:hypothetical protein